MSEKSVHDLCVTGLERAEPATGVWPKPVNRVEEFGLSDLRQRLEQANKRIAYLEEKRASAQRMFDFVAEIHKHRKMGLIPVDADDLTVIIALWKGVFERDEGK